LAAASRAAAITVGSVSCWIALSRAGTTLRSPSLASALAACVNVVPGVRSIYRWQGKICDDAEVLCLVKTRPALFERARQRLFDLRLRGLMVWALTDNDSACAFYLSLGGKPVAEGAERFGDISLRKVAFAWS